MHKNLTEMAAHKEGLWAEIVVFKQFFPGDSVSLFHKISYSHPLLNGYCIYFRTALSVMNCVYTMYLTDISTKGVLQFQKRTCSHISEWVPPLFQEATCSDLLFSRVLSFFEISTCNRLCFQRYWVNSPPVAAIHSTNDPFSVIKEQL